MCGVKEMFQTSAAPNDDVASVPISAVILQINSMAMMAPILYQHLYERATQLFARMHAPPVLMQDITRDQYVTTIQDCQDALVQGK